MPRKRVAKKPKISKAMLKQMMGQGFFGDLWSGIKNVGRKVGDFAKDKLTKPSTYLGLAGMLPTPLAPAFKAGAFASGLAGHGKRKKRVGGRRAPKSGVIRL